METIESAAGDEFVGFNLGQVGFIMRRAPFFAAVHREPGTADAASDAAEGAGDAAGTVVEGFCAAASAVAVAEDGTAVYLDSVIRFNDRDVPLFRLDDFLRSIFRIAEPSRLRAALVARIDAFGPACAEAFKAAARHNLGGADLEYLALGIGGNGAIRNIAWQELRPAPSSLRRFLWTRGIVACRFGEPGRIEYLIDPADLCLPVLENRGETA